MSTASTTVSARLTDRQVVDAGEAAHVGAGAGAGRGAECRDRRVALAPTQRTHLRDARHGALHAARRAVERERATHVLPKPATGNTRRARRCDSPETELVRS